MFYGRISRLIIFLNILVFLLWNFSEYENIENTWLYRNFLVSWEGLIQGRIWILITSVFSHNTFFHLFFNMFVLHNFGPILERVLGEKSFVKFYISAGIISSLAHALVSAFILDKPSLPALGASGAISSIILVFSLLFPKQILLLFGFIPVRALVGAIIFIGIDIWGLVMQAEGGGLPIGHGAHLGGAFFGVFYYYKRKITSHD